MYCTWSIRWYHNYSIIAPYIKRHIAIFRPCWDQDVVSKCITLWAKCCFAAKPLQDSMTAQIRMRLTLRSFKHEKHKVSINATWTESLFVLNIFLFLFCVLPSTAIRKLHVLLFPLLSTASHLTNVWPIVKLVPDCKSQVTSGTFPELSVTEGFCQTAAANSLVLAVYPMFGYQDKLQILVLRYL